MIRSLLLGLLLLAPSAFADAPARANPPRQAAIASANAYVSVNASGCPGSGPWPRRVSLTPAGLAPAHARLLLIRGEAKRELFERALDGEDVLELPIRLTFLTPGAPLLVHWAP